MIVVKNLRKELAAQQVLNGVDMTVEDGEILALLGASGAGKSVLLRTLVGLLEPDSGEVLIDDVDIHRSRGKELASIRDRIGMLFQAGALFDSMTVYDNLAFPLREKTRMTRTQINARVEKYLQRVGLSEAVDKYPAELSGGMQKRAALARTLVGEPKIIFFDEPTTGLDPLIGNSILRLICDLHEEFKFTAVIVTHNFQKVFQIVNRVAMLDEGVIRIQTTPEEFMEFEHPSVQNFVIEALQGPLEAVKNDSQG